MTSILHNVEHGVMTLTIHRVDKKNALTADMYAALADALTKASNHLQLPILRYLVFYEVLPCFPSPCWPLYADRQWA